jgi:predicted enzyme related to lactoylglutathione lyase
MPPASTNGKICYLEIPAENIAASAEFYRKIFGWNIRDRGNGELSFDDTVGGVSGMWVLGRPPANEHGVRISIMVDSVAATLDAIVAAGGEIHTPIGAGAPEITARFRDPYGNILSLYQEPA